MKGRAMRELFEKQAEVYAHARPTYPESLFSFLASLTPSHSLVWDVGTGNGQAAAAICQYYDKVIATDVSDQQLRYAVQRPNITYSLTSSILTKEELGRVLGPEGSVDLVIIAEALHWFDHKTFYENVKHVLRNPGGIIAAWVYRPRPKTFAPVDKVLDDFFETIQHHWAPQVQSVEEEYRNLPFPFSPAVKDGKSIGSREFEVTMEANLEAYIANLRTWSAVQTAIDQGEDPLDEHQRKLFADAWGPHETVRRMRWPLHVLIGTLPTIS